MRYLPFLLLATLVACATPQQSCIANATRDLQVVEGLIATTRENLRRGYAIGSETTFATEEQVCGQDAKGKKIYCDVAVPETREVPVAIDLNAERAKLESLLARRDRMQAEADAAIAQCRSLYPEA